MGEPRQVLIGPRRQLLDVNGDKSQFDVLCTVVAEGGATFSGAVASQNLLDSGSPIELREFPGEMRVRVTSSDPSQAQSHYIILEGETELLAVLTVGPYDGPTRADEDSRTMLGEEGDTLRETVPEPVAPPPPAADHPHPLLPPPEPVPYLDDLGGVGSYITLRNLLVVAAIAAIGLAVYYLWTRRAPVSAAVPAAAALTGALRTVAVPSAAPPTAPPARASLVPDTLTAGSSPSLPAPGAPLGMNTSAAAAAPPEAVAGLLERLRQVADES